MPPIAMAAIGAGSSIAGSILGQKAANKGPQAVFPQQLGQYLNLLNPLATSASGTLGQMIATGMPTDVGPAWQAMVGAQQQQVQQGRADISAQFARSGLRYGTPMTSALSTFESQTNKDFMSILANYTFQAQEAARQRQLAASTGALSAFGDIATTLTSPQGSTLGAGLSSAGQQLQFLSLLKALGV
jgi:hypothetical protein